MAGSAFSSAEQSAAMITDFVEKLIEMGDKAELSGVRC